MESDFNGLEPTTEPTASSDFAGVGTDQPSNGKPEPIRETVLALATAQDSRAGSLQSLVDENIDLVRQRIASGEEFSMRIRAAADQQERRAKSMRTWTPSDVPAPTTADAVRVLDEGYKAIVSQRVEDNEKVAAEQEAIRRVQDDLEAGDTVSAKLSYDLFRYGGATQRWYANAERNLIASQYLERLGNENAESSWLDTVRDTVESLIPGNYNFAASGVVPGSRTSVLSWLMSGSNLGSQADTLLSRYRDNKDFAAALRPGGELDTSIRSNASTWGHYSPAVAAELGKNLLAQDAADRSAANLWGGLVVAEAIPGIGWVPWASARNVPSTLMHLGARRTARDATSEAFRTFVEEGTEAAARKGFSEADLVESTELSIMNPSVSSPNRVPLGTDLTAALRSSEVMRERLPTMIQSSRFTNAEEALDAFTSALRAEEKLAGRAIKDYRFAWRDAATGEEAPFVKGSLPEQGNVVGFIEYTVGKLDGGGFATPASAAAAAAKRGLDDVTPFRVDTEVDRVVRNADEGFTVRAYHGTASRFDAYDNARAGSSTGGENTKGGVTFFSSNPDVAHSYARLAAGRVNRDRYDAAQAAMKDAGASATDEQFDEMMSAMDDMMEGANTIIRPVDVNPSKLYTADMKGAAYNGPTTQAILDKARADGYEGVVFRNYDDDIFEGALSDIYALFDANVTSRPSFNTITRDVSGQWFLKRSINVADQGFRTAPLNTPNNSFMASLRSDARRADRDGQVKAVVGGQAAGRFNKAVQTELKAALKGVSKADKLSLDEIIRKGQNESVWLTDSQLDSVFERVAGYQPPERVRQAYRTFRTLNDFEFVIRNGELYKNRVMQGYENARFSIGSFEFNDAAKISTDGPRPTARVYNATDNVHYTKDRPLTDAEFKRLQGDGYAVVTTVDPIRLASGAEMNTFMVRRGDLRRSALNRQQLAYKAGGHRLYTGRFFAKQAAGGVQPDTGQTFLRNPNVFRTSNNPNLLRDWASVMNRAIDDFNDGIVDPQHYDDQLFVRGDLGFPDGAEFVDAMEKGLIDSKHRIEIVGDREMPSAYVTASDEVDKFMDEDVSGTTGYFRTTGRMFTSRRGQHLLDETGEFAETVDPWDAMNTALFNISRVSSMSGYKTNVLERFDRTYRRFLDLRQPEKATPSDLINAAVKDGVTDRALVSRIKGEQAAMARIMNHETDFDKRVRLMNEGIADWVLGEARSGPRLKAYDFWHWLQEKHPIRALRAIAFDAKLGLFNVGQLFLQTSTIIAAGAIDPRNGMRGVASMMPLYLHTIGRGDGALMDVLAKRTWKAAGFASEGDQKEFMRFVERTGFMTVDNTHLQINDFGPNRVFGSGGGIDAVREKGRTFFYMAEQFNRAVASRIAYEQVKDRGLVVGTAEFRDNFMKLADDLSFNMTNESSAAFQHGFLSIPTQFWSYQTRMMDALFGKTFTKEQRARLVASQFLFFGASGVPLADSMMEFWKNREGDPEMFDIESMLGVIDRGLLDKAAYEVVGADVQIGSRLGSGEFWTTLVKDVFGQSEFGEKSTAEMLGGAGGSISADIFGTLGSAASYAFAETGADQGWTLTGDELLKLAMNISTVSNTLKGIWLYNYGTYYSNKLGVQATGVPSESAVAVALGFQPQEIEDASTMMSYLNNKKEVVSEAAKQVRTWRQEAFTRPDLFEENMKKVNAFVAMLPAEIRMDVLKQTNRTTDDSFYSFVARKYETERQEEVMQETLNGGE